MEGGGSISVGRVPRADRGLNFRNHHCGEDIK